ncbi:MAG: hypothetical protein IJQ56_09680 [Synergistaceae bacterium]|nr:hypothetical protein [Synergistaceae bacterium]
MGQNNFLKWVTLPPVVSILTIMLARSMGSGSIVGEVDLAIWGLIWLTFIILSILYGLFITNGFSIGLPSLQAVAQGIILCPMAIVYGARMFQWLGVLLAVCGAAALVVAYNQAQNEKNKVIVKEVENDMRKLPLNYVITDETGGILNFSEDMLSLLDIELADIMGKNISDWFSPVAKTAEINDKIWDIRRKSIENGHRFYFELTPKGLPVGSEGAETLDTQSTESVNDMQFIDPDTKLHTYNYGLTRISDELYRVGRYSHPVSAIMIRIVFPQLLPDEDMEKYVRPFRAYCERIKKEIRQTDTVIQTGEFQLLIVMSECNARNADMAAERFISIVNALCPTFEEFLRVTVLNVTESIENPDNVPQAQELIDRMTHAMTRKYSATALTQ